MPWILDNLSIGTEVIITTMDGSDYQQKRIEPAKAKPSLDPLKAIFKEQNREPVTQSIEKNCLPIKAEGYEDAKSNNKTNEGNLWMAQRRSEEFPESITMKKEWDDQVQSYNKLSQTFNALDQHVLSPEIQKNEAEIIVLRYQFLGLWQGKKPWTEKDFTTARKYVDTFKSKLQELRAYLDEHTILVPEREGLTKAYEFPQWEITPRDVSLSRQTKTMDSIKRIVGIVPREHRPQRVEKVVSTINSELRKIRELLESSCFEYSLKHNIRNQMDNYVQHGNESYDQALQYDGQRRDQGKARREQGEQKLNKILSDIQKNRELIRYLKFLGFTNTNDIKCEINYNHNHFIRLLEDKRLNLNNTELTKLSELKESMKHWHQQVTCSCREKDFLEAGKWAKLLLSGKEAFENYLINRSFQTHFLSRIAEQATSQAEQTQLAKIDRHTPISAVPEKWRQAFAVARGRAIAEKISHIPDKDINTEKAFNHRYKNDIKVIKKGDNEVELKVMTYVKGDDFSKYISHIKIDQGIIRTDHNFKNSDAISDGKPLPNSEIFYNQLLSALRHQKIDPSNFNLTQVIREKISNKESVHTFDFCIKPLMTDQAKNNTTDQFKKGSDGYYILLGIPNAWSTLFLLKQHRSTFGKREVSCIEVKDDPSLDITLHIGQ